MNIKFSVARALILCPILAAQMTAAYSLGRGSDPYATPVISPITQQPTDSWKLAGAVSQPGGSASGVQISAQWILTAKHFLGSTPAANTVFFKNAYGNSALNQCFFAPSGNDLTLCSLAAPIQTPANFVFPKLVGDPTTLFNGRPLNLVAPLFGAFLEVGFGSPYIGQARYAWVDLFGVPYDANFRPALVGISPLVPYMDGGDSGSPLFWAYPGKSSEALVSIAHYGGAIKLNSVFSTSDLTWIASTVSSYSNNVIATESALSYAGVIASSPPWLDYDSLKIASSTPTSVSFNWKKPAANSNLVKRYLVTIEDGDVMVNSKSINASASGDQSSSFVGLTTGKNYTLCVTPAGLGVASMGDVSIANGYTNAFAVFQRNCKFLNLSPTPGPVQGLTITNSTMKSGGVVYPSFIARWTPPITPANVNIASYQANESSDGTPTPASNIGNVLVYQGGLRAHGERICVIITPIGSPANIGAASLPACITLP